MILNDDIFFERFVNFVVNTFAVLRANSKFQFVQQSAKFIPKHLLQNKPPRESVIINCFLNFYMAYVSVSQSQVQSSDDRTLGIMRPSMTLGEVNVDVY